MLENVGNAGGVLGNRGEQDSEGVVVLRASYVDVAGARLWMAELVKEAVYVFEWFFAKDDISSNRLPGGVFRGGWSLGRVGLDC